jgi:hypothetical protein
MACEHDNKHNNTLLPACTNCKTCTYSGYFCPTEMTVVSFPRRERLLKHRDNGCTWANLAERVRYEYYRASVTWAVEGEQLVVALSCVLAHLGRIPATSRQPSADWTIGST